MNKNKLAQKFFEERKLIFAERCQRIIDNLKAGKPTARAFGEVIFDTPQPNHPLKP